MTLFNKIRDVQFIWNIITNTTDIDITTKVYWNNEQLLMTTEMYFQIKDELSEQIL